MAFHSRASASSCVEIGEHGLGPGGSGAGYDGPVDRVACNQFHGRTVRFRNGAIRPAHLLRIFLGEQRGIIAGDRQSRRAAPERLGQAIVEPGGSGVEAGVLAVAIAQQRRLLVRKQRGDEGGSRFIGVLGDAARQGKRVERGGHHQLLSRRKSESGMDGHFGQTVEIFPEFGCVGERLLGKWCGRGHGYQYHANRSICNWGMGYLEGIGERSQAGCDLSSAALSQTPMPKSGRTTVAFAVTV